MWDGSLCITIIKLVIDSDKIFGGINNSCKCPRLFLASDHCHLSNYFPHYCETGKMPPELVSLRSTAGPERKTRPVAERNTG
jgi:hypothetical protein